MTTNWINTSKELPKKTGIPYLIFYDGFILVAYFHIDPNDNKPWWESDCTIEKGVTHWMPLPDKPILTN